MERLFRKTTHHSTRPAQSATDNQEPDLPEALPARDWLETFFEHANDAIFVLDLENNTIVEANPQACDMLGYTREELLETSISMIHPGEMPEFKDFLEKAIEEGHRWSDEFTCRRKDGRRVPCEISASSVEANRDTYILAHVRETADRRKVKQWLSGQNKILEMIASDTSLDGVLEALCQTIEDLVPGLRACVLVLDREKERFERAVGPSFPEEFVATLSRISARPPRTDGKAVFDGTPVVSRDVVTDDRWSEAWKDLSLDHDIHACRSAPIRASDGTPLGSLFLCFSEPDHMNDRIPSVVDVGTHLAGIALERARADRERERLLTREKAARHEAQAAERRLRELVGDLNAIVWEADVSTFEFTYVSPQAEEILGYPPREWLGELDFWSEIIHTEDGREVMEYCRRHVQNGQSHTVEFRARTASDEVIWLKSIANVITDDTGQPENIRGVMVDITERKEAEQKLRQSKKRFRRLLEKLPAAAYMCDREGLITYYNERAVEVWGRKPKLHDPADRFCGSFQLYTTDGTPVDRSESAMAQALQNNQEQQREFIVEHPDGKRVAGLVHAVPLHDASGDLIGAVNVAVDITERKQAERLQQEQTQLLEMIASGASLEDCLSTLCEAVPRLHPGARASILLADEEGTSFQRPIAPDLQASWNEGLEGAPINDLMIGTCGEAVFQGEPIVCEDVADDERWSDEWRELCLANGVCAGYSVPIRSGKDEPLGSFMLCFDEPRTPSQWEKRLAEFGTHVASVAVEHDRRRHALQQSNDRLAAQAADMRRLHALSTRLLRQESVEAALHEVMEASAELLGADKASTQIYDEEEEVLRLVSYFGFDRAFADQFQVVNTGSITTCAAALEKHEQVLVEDLSTDPNYAEFYRAVTRYDARAAFSTPLYDSDGRLLGMFTMYWENPHRPSDDELKLLDLYTRQAARQIERQRTAEELQRAKEEAEKTARLRSNLLANVSHEIRTPITGIVGLAEGLKEKVSDARREEVQLIEKSAHRLMDTLESVMALAQLEGGEVEITPERLDVTAQVEEMAESLRPLAEEKELSFEITSDAPDAEAHLDPTLLGRILDNLVSNAVKFTEEGGITVTVSASADHVSIAVSDTGVGISEEFQARLFKEFTQESTGFSRSHEGIGLGLALTKKMTEEMDGDISVESEKGEGSTFTVRFPRASFEEDAGLKAGADEFSPDGSTTRTTTSVLLIEDNEVIQRVMTERLEEDHDYRVEVFGTAEPALERAKEQAFDVVLIDICLPDIDGVEALHRLRSTETYRDRPIIAVTGQALPGDREQFLAEGFSAYMGKPFSAGELAEKIQAISE